MPLPCCLSLHVVGEELIDDVDKLSLLEAAVILNAFAHFQCYPSYIEGGPSSHDD